MRKLGLILFAIWGHTAAAQGWRCSSLDDSVCQDSLLNKIQQSFSEVFNEDPVAKTDTRHSSFCMIPPGIGVPGPGGFDRPVPAFKTEFHDSGVRIHVTSAELFLATNLATVILSVEAQSTLTGEAPWTNFVATPALAADRVVLNFTPQPTAYHQGVQQIGEILSDSWQTSGIANTQFSYRASYPGGFRNPPCVYTETLRYDRGFLNQAIAEAVRARFLKAIDRAIQ